MFLLTPSSVRPTHSGWSTRHFAGCVACNACQLQVALLHSCELLGTWIQGGRFQSIVPGLALNRGKGTFVMRGRWVAPLLDSSVDIFSIFQHHDNTANRAAALAREATFFWSSPCPQLARWRRARLISRLRICFCLFHTMRSDTWLVS